MLKKGLDLEFVIAKRNEKTWGLVRKFKYTEKYVTENTVTIHIPAESPPLSPEQYLGDVSAIDTETGG